MSPEQARGTEVDARSDLFSFGLVLFEMLTGTRAFAGSSTVAILDAVLHSAPPAVIRLNAAVPTELERIIERAIEKDRELRYQTAAEIRAELRRLQRDTGSRQTSSLEVPAAAPSRAKIPVRAIALAVLVLAAVFAGWRFAPRAPALTAKDEILVGDFANTTGDPVFDDTLKQALTVQLRQSPYLNVVSDDRVRQTLRFMQKPSSERLTDPIAREVCQRQESRPC